MSEDQANWPPVEPIAAGLKGRCPRCGEGRLFSGFLTVAPRCSNCGLDYSFADAGDGPAVFVILIIGFVVVGWRCGWRSPSTRRSGCTSCYGYR